MTKERKLVDTKKRDVLRKKVGKSIKEWRLGQGLVLTEIADKINTSQGSLSDLENGHCLPSFQTVLMLRKKYPDNDWNRILFA